MSSRNLNAKDARKIMSWKIMSLFNVIKDFIFPQVKSYEEDYLLRTEFLRFENDIQLKFNRLEDLITDKISAVTLDLSKTFNENISSINRKGQAIAKIIEKSKNELKMMQVEAEKDYSFLHGITTRLANMDQQIKALQNGKAK